MGSGINTTFRQAGIATGIAGLGAIFQSQVAAKLSQICCPNAPGGLAEAVSSGGSRAAALAVPPGRRAEVVHAAKIAFVSGFNEILLIGAVICLVGAVLGFALVRARDFVQAPDGAATEPAPA